MELCGGTAVFFVGWCCVLAWRFMFCDGVGFCAVVVDTGGGGGGGGSCCCYVMRYLLMGTRSFLYTCIHTHSSARDHKTGKLVAIKKVCL